MITILIVVQVFLLGGLTVKIARGIQKIRGAAKNESDITMIGDVGAREILATSDMARLGEVGNNELVNERNLDLRMRINAAEERIRVAKMLLLRQQAEQSKADELLATRDDETEEHGYADADDGKVFIMSVDRKTGVAILVRYRKSCTAKLIQSEGEVKEQYSQLKNHILSYGKVNNRTSWSYDSFNSGRKQLAKLGVSGKTLYLYLPLNPDDYADSKYKVDKTESKKYAAVPCVYKIKNARRAKYAIDLIDEVMKQHEIKYKQAESYDYVSELPYQSTAKLIKRELIKELVTKEKYDEFLQSQSDVDMDSKVRQFISASEVEELLSDARAKSMIINRQEEVEHDGKKKRVVSRDRGIINIDTIAASFQDGDIVTLETLKEKKLVHSNIKHIKVLARGFIDKKLKVEADEFSLQAVKMIILTGGRAINIG